MAYQFIVIGIGLPDSFNDIILLYICILGRLNNHFFDAKPIQIGSTVKSEVLHSSY